VSGRYLLVGHSSSLKTINSRCSSGCVYVKQEDTSDTQYCFQPSQQGKSSCSKNCENSLPNPPGNKSKIINEVSYIFLHFSL
jgi:ribosomal protein S27E